jgi:hypothetical protein
MPSEAKFKILKKALKKNGFKLDSLFEDQGSGKTTPETK